MAENRDLISSLIRDLAILELELDNYISQNYFNSQPVISIQIFYRNRMYDLSFKLSDILLIGALTQSSVLLSGSSGSGKTFLAELIMEALFGQDGYTRKNITPDMNEQDFMDIDFGAIKDGKTLKEAMKADELFNRPSLIIDEANRAPPIIQNRLLQILENNIDLKSKTIHAGKKLSNNTYYHWNILTLNYGTEYAGTSTVDRALKDRITIDIPIDNFPPTLDDQISMIHKPLEKDNSMILDPKDEIIYNIYQNLNKIQLSLEAEALILYLSFTSNCVKSPTGSKYGVLFSPHFCKEQNCPYARNPPLNEICPYTYAPSNRILRRLVHTSKGFCLLKHAKIYNKILTSEGEAVANDYLKTQNFDVSLKDVISLAPLILHSKISMNQEWVLNKFNGNMYLACSHFMKIINKQLEFFMTYLLKPLVSEKRGNEISEKDKGIRNKALKDDFHFKGLIKYVIKHLN
ncbi:MAG: AAA family ATPase [Promethearchaeota archaeon]